MTPATATTFASATDRGAAHTFLTALYGDIDEGVISICRRIPRETSGRDRDGIGVEWFTPDQLDAAADSATTRGQTTCIWFGVATRRQKLPWGERGGVKDCVAIPALWLDLDVHGLRTTVDGEQGSGHSRDAELFPDLNTAYAALDEFPLRPSVIVESGGGLQPYWLLDQPHLLDGSDLLARWRATWKARLGRRVDAVFNADRIMRLPGSINHKRGLVPAPVVIAAATSDHYTFTDLEAVLDYAPTRPAPPANSPRANTGEDSWVGAVVDDYNKRTNWVDENAGEFEYLETRDGIDYWHAIGAEGDVGATTNANGTDRMIVFSHTAGNRTGWRVYGSEEPTPSYDRFSARMLRETGRDPIDDTEARVQFARQLRREGYGPPETEDWLGVTPVENTTTSKMVTTSTGETEVPIPSSFDDALVGEAFGQLIAGRYLYCGQLGGWLAWDGRRWQRDHTEAVFEEARQYILDLGAHLFRIGADPKTLKACAAYRDMRPLARAVTAARRLRTIAAGADEFDRHPDLLNTRNGVVDLRTGELGPHDPTVRLTKLTDVDYRPDATHEDVAAVLEVVDEPVRGWLQVFTGYSATGHVSEDLLPVLDGTGSNGKTTLLGSVAAALGEYACPAPTKLLMRGGGDEHPTLIADLHGRRFVTIEETAEGGSLAVERMKALTGGSVLKARFMRQNYFSFEAVHQLLIATNHRPAVNSTEHATWRRLRLIPFPNRYAKPEEARPGDRPIDRGLRARLRTGRSQREAMLAWIVAGAVRWQRDGLHDCAEITKATDEWRKAEDVIYRFVTERCEIGSGTSVKSSELHRAYADWCDAEGRPSCSNKEFTKRLSDHDLAAEKGIQSRHTRTGNAWFGLGLGAWL